MDVKKKITPEEVEHIKESFKAMDTDGNGTIDAQEFKAALLQNGEHVTDEDVNVIIASIDKNGDGVIQLNEFIEFMSSDDVPEEDITRSVFVSFDTDGNGVIDFEEYFKAISSVSSVTREEAKESFDSADTDKNGFIDYEEFKAIYNS